MKRSVRIAVAYTLFAVLATLVNLGSQWLTLRVIARLGLSLPLGLDVLAALVVGTGTGLVVKYVLDKRYIFNDFSTGAAVHARKFSLYTAMGLVTTVIFWGAEFLGAWRDPRGPGLYIGGALGLAVGYVIKYHLDKMFVFDTAIGERRLA